jgi:hypothetical protein
VHKIGRTVHISCEDFITVQNLICFRFRNIRGSFKMFPESFLFPRNTKPYAHLSCISFKLVPLCNYTLLSATVKMSETFLEAILWKSFQLFPRMLDGVSSSTKSPSLQCWFQSREQLKISGIQVRRIRDAPMLSHFSLLRNPWGHAVAQLVERKVAGSIPDGVFGFFHWQFFRPHYGPGVDSATNRNEYQEFFLWVKAAGA